MDLTVYNLCEDVLKEACYAINENNDKKTIRELTKFLTTNHPFDALFEMYKEYIDIDKIKNYKAIMMLIIVSTSYKTTVLSLTNNRSYEACLSQLNEMDELTPKTIINGFKNGDEAIADYILDYFDYIYSNYIYANDCIESVIKEEKIKNILNINPFEALRFLDYIEPNNLLTSERDLQDYLTIQENAISELMEENCLEDDEEIELQDLQEKVIEMTEEKLGYDSDRIRKFYGYIFSNVYEAIKVTECDFLTEKDELQGLIEYFEDSSVTVDDVMNRYYEDLDFFNLISQIFSIANEDLVETDLIIQRDGLKQTDGVEVVKKLNPYYEEEEIVFQKIKQNN